MISIFRFRFYEIVLINFEKEVYTPSIFTMSKFYYLLIHVEKY